MTEPMEYEHEGRWWQLWYRRGDTLYLKRKVGLNQEETYAINLRLERQKQFPNIALLNAVDLGVPSFRKLRKVM